MTSQVKASGEVFVDSLKGQGLFILIALRHYKDECHIRVTIDWIDMMTHPQSNYNTLIAFCEWMCHRNSYIEACGVCSCVCCVGVRLYMNTAGHLIRLSSLLAADMLSSWIMQTLLNCFYNKHTDTHTHKCAVNLVVAYFKKVILSLTASCCVARHTDSDRTRTCKCFGGGGGGGVCLQLDFSNITVVSGVFLMACASSVIYYFVNKAKSGQGYNFDVL